MKPWTSLDAIPMPANIAGLPKDERGYPIPVTAAQGVDGKRDFRVIDVNASHRCFTYSMCAICGQPLGRHRAFVGGPRSIVHRLFNDLWMHRDCAEYALQVCPYLAAPKFAYSRAEPHVEGHVTSVVTSVSEECPVVFGMGVTDQGAEYVKNGDDIVIRAGEFHTIQWWMGGKQITAQEAADAILAAKKT